MSSISNHDNGARQKLLIVDDEAKLLEILLDSAESLGFQVITANDGLMAVDILKTQKVDIIISDINMPRYSGIQLLSKCRKMNVMAPFIFFTGNSTVENLIDAVRLGASDFITKPFELATFEKILKRVSAIAVRQDHIEELLNSFGRDVAPQTHLELQNLRRQIDLLKAMSQGD